MSGYRHAPAPWHTLPIEYDAAWTPITCLNFWRKETFSPASIRPPDHSVRILVPTPKTPPRLLLSGGGTQFWLRVTEMCHTALRLIGINCGRAVRFKTVRSIVTGGKVPQTALGIARSSQHVVRVHSQFLKEIMEKYIQQSTGSSIHILSNLSFRLHTLRTTDYRHTRQDRWIQTELAFTPGKNATKPNPSEIITLQTAGKENNWETEEALVRAAVTVETERIKGSNSWCLWWWWWWW